MTNATIAVENTTSTYNQTAIANAAEKITNAQADTTAVQQAEQYTMTVRKAIEQLVVEREVWEDSHVRTANEYLANLLQKSYGLYKCLEGNSAEAKGMRQALKDYYGTKGYTYRPSTHTMNKIVRCVFAGTDEMVSKHRVSSYAIALRYALTKNVTVENLPAFLSTEGGVEALRAKAAGRPYDTVTAKQKAVLGSLKVKNEELGSFKHQAAVEKFDAGKADRNVVLLGTWQFDGSITVRAVVESKGVVNAALASFHSTKKAEEAKKVAEFEQKALADAAADAIKEAANEAFLSKLVNGQ